MLRFSFTSLRSRLLLLVLLAVIPALGLICYTNVELRRLAAADVQAQALRLVRMAANDQEDSIKDTHQLLFALAQLPQVNDADATACSSFFASLLHQYPQYVLLGVVDPDGDLFCSALPADNRPVNLADHDYFQRSLQTRAITVSGYQSDPVSGKAALNFSYPVLDEAGQVRAVVFAALDLSWLNQIAAEAQLPQGSTFTVIDRDGTILVRYPDPGVWVGQSVPEAPIVKTILSQPGEGTAQTYGVDGVSRLFAFTPLYSAPGNGNVYVSIGIPTSVAFANANRLLARNLAGLGLVTVLALAAAWWGGDLFVLRPVTVLLDAARRLSRGDLSARTGLPYGQGELSHLAYTFDEMAESLERRVAERDEAEAALRESQRVLSTLMSNLPGIAYRCYNDRDRTMEFVSEGCFALTGYSAADLVGSRKASYAHLIHPEDREAVWNEMQAALTRDASFQLTYRITTACGEKKWVWEQGRGVKFSHEAPTALEGFITDITDRVLAYQLMEQRVADRTRDLSALYDVTAVASESLDLDTVLRRSLERVLAVMGSELGAIHLLDETQQRLKLVAWQGIRADYATRLTSVPTDSGLVGWVVEQGRPLVLPDLASSPRPLLAIPAAPSQAYLGVPIRARGHMLGVLSVVGEAGRHFHPEEVTLLDSIADQIGVAVENARLYDSEQARRRQADTLLEVTSIVSSTLELDEVMSHILDQLQRVVSYDSASVQLLHQGALQVVAGRGFSDLKHVLGLTFALNNDSPNYKVIERRRPLSLDDAPALYPAFRQPPYSHIKSWLGVPLHVHEHIIGIITLDRRQPGGYSQEEIRLATAFAGQAALALENARLYQEAEQLAIMKERARLARELHDSVTQALYSMNLLAEAGGRLAAAEELQRVQDYLARLGQTAQEALQEMRLLIYELRPPILEQEGLVGALQQRLDAVEGRAGVETRLRVEGTIKLPSLVEDGLYRIAQEALNNALKHAAAGLVTVRIRAGSGQVELEVTDNGTGFDPETISDRGGMGLVNMHDRAERLGGKLSVNSAPGQGTQVKVSIQIDEGSLSFSRSLIGALEFPEVL